MDIHELWALLLTDLERAVSRAQLASEFQRADLDDIRQAAALALLTAFARNPDLQDKLHKPLVRSAYVRATVRTIAWQLIRKERRARRFRSVPEPRSTAPEASPFELASKADLVEWAQAELAKDNEAKLAVQWMVGVTSTADIALQRNRSRRTAQRMLARSLKRLSRIELK